MSSNTTHLLRVVAWEITWPMSGLSVKLQGHEPVLPYTRSRSSMWVLECFKRLATSKSNKKIAGAVFLVNDNGCDIGSLFARRTAREYAMLCKSKFGDWCMIFFSWTWRIEVNPLTSAEWIWMIAGMYLDESRVLLHYIVCSVVSVSLLPHLKFLDSCNRTPFGKGEETIQETVSFRIGRYFGNRIFQISWRGLFSLRSNHCTPAKFSR